MNITYRLFQSTHPHGVRPPSALRWAWVLSFNPRTRTGCDAPGVYRSDRYGCFNPRTRTGCDAHAFSRQWRIVQFQSTHPHGVRPYEPYGYHDWDWFQSTHPHGVRREIADKTHSDKEFQSTHPHGVRHGSTFWDLPGEVKKKILDDYLPDVSYVAADFTQLDSDRPYELGIYLDRQVEIGKVFDDIDLSVCATSGFNRIGEFSTAAITLPGSSASVTFSNSPNEYIKFVLSKEKVPDVVWRVVVEYRVDNSKSGDDDLTRREAAEISTILYLYPAADEKTITSLLRDQADAAAVAALYLALLGTQLWFPKFTTKIKPFRVQFLEDVRVINSDYGVSGYYTVIGMAEDYAKSEVTLTCYGDD